MKIIAETENGFLIEATRIEAQTIVRATHGSKTEKVCVGIKITASDYATVITKLQGIPYSYDIEELERHTDNLLKTILDIKEAVKVPNETY